MASLKRISSGDITPAPNSIKRQKSKPVPLSTTLAEANAIIITFQRPIADPEIGSIRIECLESAETVVVCNGSAISLEYGDTFESTNEANTFDVVVGTQSLTYSWVQREASSQETVGTFFSETPFQVYETSTAPTTAATVQTASTITQGSSKSNLENNSPKFWNCGSDYESAMEPPCQHEGLVDFHGKGSSASQSIERREACSGNTTELQDCDTAATDSKHGTWTCPCIHKCRGIRSRRASI